VRTLEVQLLDENADVRFILALHGRPESALLGFTADELGQASIQLRQTITDLVRERELSPATRASLEEIHGMLRHPSTDPNRMQPIALADVVSCHVLAQRVPK
jgi:hypothetical protein